MLKIINDRNIVLSGFEGVALLTTGGGAAQASSLCGCFEPHPRSTELSARSSEGNFI